MGARALKGGKSKECNEGEFKGLLCFFGGMLIKQWLSDAFYHNTFFAEIVTCL